jgi:hypothetical protein
MRRCIIKTVNVMKSTLSSHGKKQKKREQKTDFQTFQRVILTYRPCAKKMVIVLLSIVVTTALNLVVSLMIPQTKEEDIL